MKRKVTRDDLGDGGRERETEEEKTCIEVSPRTYSTRSRFLVVFIPLDFGFLSFAGVHVIHYFLFPEQ